MLNSFLLVLLFGFQTGPLADKLAFPEFKNGEVAGVEISSGLERGFAAVTYRYVLVNRNNRPVRVMFILADGPVFRILSENLTGIKSKGKSDDPVGPAMITIGPKGTRVISINRYFGIARADVGVAVFDQQDNLMGQGVAKLYFPNSPSLLVK